MQALLVTIIVFAAASWIPTHANMSSWGETVRLQATLYKEGPVQIEPAVTMVSKQQPLGTFGR